MTDGSHPDAVESTRNRPAKTVLDRLPESLEIRGHSAIEVALLFAPALLTHAIGRFVLDFYGLVTFLVSLGLFVLATAILLATPKGVSVAAYLGSIVAHYTRQQIMLFDRAPDTTGIVQPVNTSFAARIGRLPGIRRLPYVGGEKTRTQEFVPVKRAYRGERAIELDDEYGSVIGVLRISPANLSTSAASTWQERVDRLADSLETALRGKVQWYNPTRAVDYSSRRSQYEARERAIVDQEDPSWADRVFADIAAERALGIDLYEQTTHTREYYVLVRVDPEDVVIADSNEGGLAGIPFIRTLLAEWRLEQGDRDDLTRGKLELLSKRMDTLQDELRTIQGLSSYQLSSSAAATVVADYFRGPSIYQFENFGQIVRHSPVPASGEAAEDPSFDVDYDPIDSLGETVAGTDAADDSPTAADGGVTASTSGDDGTVSGDGGRSIAELNPDATADVAASRAEIDAQFRGLMSPDALDRVDPNHLVIDDEWYQRTLVIRDWPKDPSNGMLESVLEFSHPDAQVMVTMQIDPLDKEKEEEKLADDEDALRDRAEQAEQGRLSPLKMPRLKWRKQAKAEEMLNAMGASKAGIFSVAVYITVRSTSPDTLSDVITRLNSLLYDRDAGTRELTFNHDSGYIASSPLTEDPVDHTVRMLGDGLASLFPWSSQNLVEPGGIEIGEHDTRGEPILLDIWGHDMGYNYGVYGNIGSGKSTTMGQLCLRAKARNPDLNLVLIDPLEGFEGTCRAFDGKRVVIGGDTSINPLHIEPLSEERLAKLGEKTPWKGTIRSAMGFIETYYGMEEGLVFEGKSGVWNRAIKLAYQSQGITADPSTHGNESPTLSTVIETIIDMANNAEEYIHEGLTDAAAADLEETARRIINNDIAPFEADGKFEHLTEQSTIDMSGSDVIYLDLQEYENDQEGGGLMMELLLKVVYEQAKVSPHEMMLAIDEAHYMLKNNANLESLKRAHRHSRHHDLSIGLATHTLSEFFADTGDETALTETAEVIFNNQSAQIFHYLEEMDAEWAGELDLTPDEMAFIKEADPGKYADGYSQALLRRQKKGCYPMRVRMDEDLNPREFAVLDFESGDYDDEVLAEFEGDEFESYLRWKEHEGSWIWRWA